MARQEHKDPFNRKSVRRALKSWDSARELGEHRLASLNIVEARRRAAGYPDTSTGRGLAVHDVLRDAIEKLRPDDGDPDFSERRWRPYIIITGQYIHGRKPDDVAEQLSIARSTYDHGQAMACDTLADILRRWEQSHGLLKPAMTSVIPRIQSFQGRQEELRYHLTQLEEEHLTIITGMPGIGKTALGAEIAMRCRRKSDVFWMTVNSGINTDIDSLFQEVAIFLYELGREEFWSFLQLESGADQRYPLHAKIQRLLRVLEAGNYTLCFDNYDLVNQDPDVTTLFEVLRERATHGRAVYLIVIGRQKPVFAVDMEFRPLTGVSKEDALSLLVNAGLTDMPQDLFNEIYLVTGGHPIFLQLLGAWVVDNGLNRFESNAVTGQVKQFVEGIAQAADIETYLLVSVFNALNPEEQRLVELMSAFRLPFDDRDEAVIEIFAEEGIEHPTLGLASLVRKHIATRVGGAGYVDCHPLLRQYFYNRLRGQLALKRRLHRRIGEYYEYFKDDYLEAAYHYRQAADYLRTVRVVDAYHKQLVGAGQAQRMLEILAPLRKHQIPIAVSPLVAAIQGEAYEFLGEYDDALDRFEEALTEFEKLSLDDEERRRAADLARRIGRLYGWRGEYEKANAYMQQALQILGDLRDEADRATAALIHTHTGSLYYLQGQLELAERGCRQALDILGDWDGGPVGATTYNVLGVVCEVSGRWDQAVDCYRRSRAIWEKLGDRHHLAQVTDNLGTLYFCRGEFPRAEKFYKENLDFWDEVGARDDAGYARLNLGAVCLVRGQWERARRYYIQAQVAWEQTGNQKLTALAHNNLGFLEIARGNYEEARRHLQQSVDEDPSAENYRGLAEAELGLGDLEQALEYAEQSLGRARETGMPFEEGVTFRTLGRIHEALGDLSRARQYLLQSLSILKELGARYEVGRTLHDAARLEERLGEGGASQVHLEEATAIFEEVGAREISNGRGEFRELSDGRSPAS